MRTTLLLASVTALFLSSCSTGNKMQSSIQNDDVYTAKTDPYVQPEVTPEQSQSNSYQYNDQSNPNPDNSTSEKYTDENGTSYVTNNYYEGSGYNFYGDDGSSYTSQLNHWYNPCVGFSYYSPFYTGFTFYNPVYYSPGISFSLSFGFGYGGGWYNPYYYPYYAYNPWYYNPWYSPYYYGYNPYCNGYYDGYYGGGCGYYGGSGYSNGYSYYGPHGSSSGNTSGDGNGGRVYKVANEEYGSSEIGSGSGFPSNNNIPASYTNAPSISKGDVKNNITPAVSGTVGNQGKNPGAIEGVNAGVKNITAKPNSLNTPGNGNLNTPSQIKSAPAFVKPATPPRQQSQLNQSNSNLVQTPSTIEQRTKEVISPIGQNKSNDQPDVINKRVYQPQSKKSNHQSEFKGYVHEQDNSMPRTNNDDHPAFNGSNSSRNSNQDNGSHPAMGSRSNDGPRRK